MLGGRWSSGDPLLRWAAAGKAADLVLLERNPLQDISATRSIDTVILNGRVYDRKALDGMLDDTRKKVAAWNAAATH